MAGEEVSIKITAEDLYSAVLNGLKDGLKQVQDSLRNVDQTAKKSADIVRQSFSNLNIRSSLDINAEKQRLVEAFQLIKLSGTSSAADINRAYQAMQQRLAELQAEQVRSHATMKTGAAVTEEATRSVTSMAYPSAVPLFISMRS